MRMVSISKSEYGTKRLMLVANPQINLRACDVVCFMYYGETDGPCEGSQLYYEASIDDVIRHLEMSVVSIESLGLRFPISCLVALMSGSLQFERSKTQVEKLLLAHMSDLKARIGSISRFEPLKKQ